MAEITVSKPSVELASNSDFLGGGKLEDGIGLCLSGGGFRAMLFHLGALVRLNELGLLPRLERVASVSGGSIAAGALAVAWRDLNFNDAGVAENLQALVAVPLLKLAQRNIDTCRSFAACCPFPMLRTWLRPFTTCFYFMGQRSRIFRFGLGFPSQRRAFSPVRCGVSQRNMPRIGGWDAGTSQASVLPWLLEPLRHSHRIFRQPTSGFRPMPKLRPRARIFLMNPSRGHCA
jgi:hypothetical protein